ncbi:hypothetical protein [Bradyrhizobium sp. CCBAU 45394]|uniref:hypothetical protein n=1 Tax=Bradyrhizobium sp. CCBAU 45394 TaxID=1325087 RepID=UPI002302FDBE|nr:hypothetical protein [Bradyrhizobium sp. CCBAU 45394]
MGNSRSLIISGVAALTLIGSAGVVSTSSWAQGYSYRDAESRYYGDYGETRRERMIERNNARRQRMIERNNYRRQEQIYENNAARQDMINRNNWGW